MYSTIINPCYYYCKRIGHHHYILKKAGFDHRERVLLHTAKVTVLAKDGSRISVNLLLVSVSQQTFMTDRLAKQRENRRCKLYRFVSSEFFFTLEHFLYYKKGYFISFQFMYNISLYPLACKQRWVFNMLIARIPSIFKFHVFVKL